MGTEIGKHGGCGEGSHSVDGSWLRVLPIVRGKPSVSLFIGISLWFYFLRAIVLACQLLFYYF